MREILFRAKRLDNGEWAEGNLVFSLDADEEWRAIIIPIKNSYMFSSGNEDEDLGFENWHKVDLETVCQYTGLTDRNGKKIFEGDILHGEFYGYPFPCNETFKIYWDEGEKGFKANYFNESNCEVIGNIFDNPELLKEGVE